MNRKEAIERLKKYVRDSIKFYEQSVSSGFGDGSYYHQIFDEIIKAFEQPITLAELLGWKENVEYADYYSVYKVVDEKLYHRYGCEDNWKWELSDCGINELHDLQQARKLEKKSRKDELLDELNKLTASERINEIIKELRELEDE